MADDGDHLGVTQPLSVDLPSKHDNELNESLLAELKSQSNFESTEETAKRNEVLSKLQRLLTQLVQIVGNKKGLPQEILKEAGGKVFTYGSYRLGVFGPGSDIDTLMIAPRHVARDDFFAYMPDLIRRTIPRDQLAELVPVPGINVPIIKLEVYGIKVDLIFSSLQIASVPKTLELTDNTLLRGLDETDLRCVNGTRVTDRIISLVPQTRVFRIALRAVKLWAERRTIYGNLYGFPGGVAYAMLVARVCQLYPKAAAPLIVNKFFFVMSKWNWPQAVVLQKREKVEFMQEREWDPQLYKGDRFDLMPIITPAYPCMNSTRGMGKSQKAVILQEMARALEITTDIYNSKKQWKDLFERHKFFSEDYKHYICIIASGMTKEAKQAWAGLVGARLKRLISGIEYSDADCVKLVHPYPKGFDGEHECKTEEELQETFDGSLSHQIVETKMTQEPADVKLAVVTDGNADAVANQMAQNTTEVPKDGPRRVWTTKFYLGIELVKGKSNLDISRPIQEFKLNCTDWENYDSELHAIRIKHVRNYDLPDDVFVAGEMRPTKKKAKKAKGMTGTAQGLAANKKRSLSSAGLDENRDLAKRRPSGMFSETGRKVHGSMVG